MKKQDISENQVNIAILGIGSNLGNRKKNIEKTKYLLQLNNIILLKCSSYYETPSWPNNKFPKYLNIIIEVKTLYNPIELFNKIKLIETKLGRIKSIKNYPRICDIDIIDFNNKKIEIKLNNTEIKIPHPRAHLRNFVLIPLYEISKTWKHPVFNKKISFLLNKTKTMALRAIKFI